MKKHQRENCPCIFCNCKCPECGGWNIELYFDGFKLENRDDSDNHLIIKKGESMVLSEKPYLVCLDCSKEFTGKKLNKLTRLSRKIVQDTLEEGALAWIDIRIEKDGQVETSPTYLCE